jgi:CheY-like chemotaxis protein
LKYIFFLTAETEFQIFDKKGDNKNIMIQMTTWLMKMEQIVSDLYFRSAKYFHDDEKLAAFLNLIAEDEAWHYHVMASALEHYRNIDSTVPATKPVITIDQQTDQKIKSALQEITDKLSANTLTKEFLFNQILFIEYSEWNMIFLYVVNSLKKTNREFMYAATKIQSHKRSIELFFENIPYTHDAILSLKNLPSVWNEKILIIEDEESVSELIREILFKEGKIDIASNGAKGFQKIKENYYKLIISDIDMPQMDGLECYSQAAEKFPQIHKRFLFLTGNPSQENRSFLRDNQLPSLTKPFHIKAIRDQALQILLNP